MPYTLIYTKRYLKRASKFLKARPEIHAQYKKTLTLLELNPHHPSLRPHALGGRKNSAYSISINMSYRIMLDIVFVDDKILLLDISTHDQVY
jgi:mRNA-degrading endonuclease YafQ of YafQ-DinJ toxin-antitoxin module